VTTANQTTIVAVPSAALRTLFHMHQR